METAAQNRDAFARIARWAASFLASSFVLAVVTLFVILVSAGTDDWFREHPLGTLVIGLLLACYSVSFACLYKLQREGLSRSVRLWSLSLAGACAPLAALTYWAGLNAAVLIIGMAEVAAVLLHLVALGMLSTRSVTV